jgi:hypothetical protein
MDVLLSGGATLTFESSQRLNLLKLSDTAKMTLATDASRLISSRLLDIAVGATLDLADNELVVDAADDASARSMLDDITALIARARNTMWNDGTKDRNWGGTGITSSTAKFDASTLTGIAVIRNIDAAGQPIQLEWPAGSFHRVNEHSILVKYTFNGDANVSGDVNALDYALINGGFLSQNTPNPLRGYSNGDFDFSGNINALDYALINGAFLGQNTRVPPAPLAKVKSPFSTNARRVCFSTPSGVLDRDVLKHTLHSKLRKRTPRKDVLRTTA